MRRLPGGLLSSEVLSQEHRFNSMILKSIHRSDIASHRFCFSARKLCAMVLPTHAEAVTTILAMGPDDYFMRSGFSNVALV